MNKIYVIIERSKDGFCAYGETVDGIWGMGETVQEAKKYAEASLSLFLENNSTEHIPEELKMPHELVYKFDTQSLLKYYKGIFTNAALERITGIHQKQIQHYATGLKKPRRTQTKKIETALHKLGNELISLEF